MKSFISSLDNPMQNYYFSKRKLILNFYKDTHVKFNIVCINITCFDPEIQEMYLLFLNFRKKNIFKQDNFSLYLFSNVKYFMYLKFSDPNLEQTNLFIFVKSPMQKSLSAKNVTVIFSSENTSFSMNNFLKKCAKQLYFCYGRGRRVYVKSLGWSAN